MPLLKFHLLKGRTDEEVGRLLETAHRVMLRSFRVPEEDRYQIVTEYEPSRFRALDTGLGFERTEKFVISRPRTKAEKIAFYENLCHDLATECDVAPCDLMISFVENRNEDWSFGLGRAQFLEGDL
ncbi:tautomerase family protein [Rhizobium leguminosarum]